LHRSQYNYLAVLDHITVCHEEAGIARKQIHDALMRYCRGIDQMDRDLILSAYHPGARDNHGTFDEPVKAFI
jgi:hypothetical protein